MLGVVNWVDGKIVKFFEKISHKFQRLTGKTNFFLARVFILAAVACNFTGPYNFYFQVLKRPSNGWSVTTATIIAVLLFIDSLTCEKLEKDSWSSTRAKRRFAFAFDPHSPWAPVVRFFFLIAAGYSLIKGIRQSLDSQYPIFEVIDSLYVLMLVIYFYFIVVTPLPPGRSKIKQWIEGFFAKPQPESVTNE